MTLRPKSLLLYLLALPIVFLLAGCGKLQSISITPVAGFVVLNSVGQTAQFTALGANQMGNASPTNSNISNAVTWTVGNPGVATISSLGLATAVGNGHTQILAESGGMTATSDLTVNITAVNTGTNGASITSISVIPGSQSVSAPGQTSQFIAIGATSTGATVNLTNQVVWTSSSPQVATVGATTGLATGVGQGIATLTALYTNAASGTVVTGIATITVAGGGTTKLTALSIIPGSQSVASLGQTGQFIAIGASPTGASVNLTNQVAWSSSSVQVATIGATTGLATAAGQGATTITALYADPTSGAVVTGTATFTVTGGTVEKFTAVTIIPGSPSVSAPGQTSQFIAIGTTSTGTTVNLTHQVTWSSSSPLIATVGASGLATAVNQGVATVTALITNAIDGSAATGIATFTVTGGTTEFTAINIAPGSQTVSASGQTSQFTAIGVTSTGATMDLTGLAAWTSSSTQIATVGASTGLATAVGPGTSTVLALYTNVPSKTVVRGIATITVGSGSTQKYATVTIIPGAQSVSSPGKTSQFTAIGVTSTGATANLTNQVAWSSSSAQIAQVDPNSGLATAMSQGIATVTAIYSDTTSGNIVTGTATITVAGGTNQQFTSMIILPGSQSLSALAQTGQFLALGTSGTTGLQQDVTNSTQLKWSSSISSVATVSASGLVTGVSAGTSSIAAVLTNVDGSVISATASVVVSVTSAPEPLLSLIVVPSSISVGNLQDTGQFLAIGTFSTVPYVRDLTNSPTLTWISSVPSVFPVNTNTAGNAGATAGIVSAYGNGSGVIIAEAKSSDGTIQTATATFNCPLTLPNPKGTPPTPGSCFPGSQAPALLSTITVYNEGLNTSGWLVTAPSATGTPDVIHCGPGSTSGGSVCVATYPFYPGGGPTIMLTAPEEPGVAFAGWSYNCTPSDSLGKPLSPAIITAKGPNYCTVTFSPAVYDSTGLIVIVPANTNVTLGAIFN